jgi:general secretion pathway protein J
MIRAASVMQSEAGFTLLELLIAMTLLGFLSVLMFTGLRFGKRAWETAEDATGLSNKVRTFQYSLREDIARAYPLLEVVDATHANIAFDGAADRLSFLVPGMDGISSGEMARVTIDARHTKSGSEIEVSAAPELAASDATRTRTIELPGVTALEFAYLGADKPTDALTWRDSWSGRTKFPALVRVSARSAHGDAVWPELIMKPRIAADMGCTYDPLTKFCQGR